VKRQGEIFTHLYGRKHFVAELYCYLSLKRLVGKDFFATLKRIVLSRAWEMTSFVI